MLFLSSLALHSLLAVNQAIPKWQMIKAIIFRSRSIARFMGKRIQYQAADLHVFKGLDG